MLLDRHLHTILEKSNEIKPSWIDCGLRGFLHLGQANLLYCNQILVYVADQNYVANQDKIETDMLIYDNRTFWNLEILIKKMSISQC